MIVYSDFKDKKLKSKPRCVAIGIFDGVHRGHQKILKNVLRDARRTRATPSVITFEPHPNKVLNPGKGHPILMSLAHRLRYFERMGLAEALVIRFNKDFSKVTRESFLNQWLLKRLDMKFLSVGHDFRFGYRGLGDTSFLLENSKRLKLGLSLVKPLKYKGEIISSTRIRHLIETGDLKKAQKMLGRPVSVYGTVVRGRGRGKGLGFPTANLNPHHETLPPSGVYAAWGYLDGKKLKGVIHIGERPTFNDKERSLEVHFLNFHKDIYGKELELIFVAKLRGTQRFKGPKNLARAIKMDIARAFKILG